MHNPLPTVSPLLNSLYAQPLTHDIPLTYNIPYTHNVLPNAPSCCRLLAAQAHGAIYRGYKYYTVA